MVVGGGYIHPYLVSSTAYLLPTIYHLAPTTYPEQQHQQLFLLLLLLPLLLLILLRLLLLLLLLLLQLVVILAPCGLNFAFARFLLGRVLAHRRNGGSSSR